MRQDTSHFWKKQLITFPSTQCSACFGNLPHFGPVFRCKDCNLLVHPYCISSFEDNCEMPTFYNEGFIEPFINNSKKELMSGYVKFWRFNKWQDAWAKLEKNLTLSFFEAKYSKENNILPFFSVDFQDKEYEIHDQGSFAESEAAKVKNLVHENLSCFIKIKILRTSIYIIASNLQEKKNWIDALNSLNSFKIKRCVSSTSVHCADVSTSKHQRSNVSTSNHRRSSSAVSIKRRFSSLSSIYSFYLEIDKSEIFEIQCSEIFDNKWLLIGAKNGLFVTDAQNPQIPVNIGGVSSIYFMESIVEHKMILIVCETIRHLAIIEFEELRCALKFKKPFVSITFIEDIDNCNVTVVSKPEHNEKRHIFVATIDSIIILRFDAEIGEFLQIKEIKTRETCTSICSTALGFIFSADNFYFVTYKSNFASLPFYIDNYSSNVPITAVQLFRNEYLLAFNNCGIFVTADGKKSRNKNFEWDRVPQEFHCTASYLYIIYREFLEVVKVASYTSVNSPTLTDNRSMFKCKSAHRIGRGLKLFEELIAVSTIDRTEIYVFHTHQLDNSNKSIMKKKK